MNTLLIINNLNCYSLLLRLTLLMVSMIQQMRLRRQYQQKH